MAERSGDSRSTWQGFKVERTLTDLRGVDNFERFLSSRHFIRGLHGMFYCMISRGVETVVDAVYYRGKVRASVLNVEVTSLELREISGAGDAG